jgi:CelD/BcsL family acetyltransferase involved in cellulose biosynthesis
MKKKYTISTINLVDKTLISQWKELWKRSVNANMFNSHEWFVTACETNNIKKYQIILCFENEKLVALLPLQKYRIYGISVYGSIDKEHIVDTGFLLESFDEQLVKHFFNAVFAGRNIYLQKVDQTIVSLLARMYPHLFIYIMSVNPQIRLTEDPFKQASHSMMSQIRGIMRKNQDKIRFESYRTNLDKYLETMLELQEESSKKERKMDIFANELHKRYYQNLTKFCKKYICINILYFDDNPIVYEYGSIYKKHYAGDQISFRTDFRKLSPGRLMMFKLFSYLKQHHFIDLDMGGGISSYKMSFTREYRTLYNVLYSPNSAIVLWWRTINTARRLKQRLFPQKFTRDNEFLFKTF